MCGITGFVDTQKSVLEQQEILLAMNESQIPRGRDANGHWICEQAGLANTRLAIMDVTNGMQPMIRVFGNTEYVLVYNGMLYNMHEIKRELENLGHTFQTTCDTEVVLLGFIHWGEACLKKFNGIFAFAIWNNYKKELFLARDRFGAKPLFYAIRDNVLVFSSELKGILAHPAVKAEIDNEGLAEVFGLGPTRSPGHGVFKNVKELPAAHYLVWRDDNIRVKRYWEFSAREHSEDLLTTAEHVRTLTKQAITGQLLSDVPICTLLSGGLDSSAISAISARKIAYDSGIRLATYSFDYEDNDKFFTRSQFQPDSDTNWVYRMVDELHTQHRYLKINNEQLIGELENAVIARDLPGMADIDSSMLYFCKQIKRNHTVVLSGECADEIFGGYPWLRSRRALDNDNFPWSHEFSLRESLLNKETKEYASISAYAHNRYLESIARVPRSPYDTPADARIRELFYLNITWFMTSLLDRSDRLSMAAGLELRVPYCDYRLAEYVWNIPWHMKNLADREKGILRFALRGLLPEDILARRKSPYPKTHNPYYETQIKSQLTEILEDSTNPICAIIDKSAIHKLMNEASDTSSPFFGQLMAKPQMYAYLLQTNFWLKHYNISIV